jgi:hypothetical protein
MATMFRDESSTFVPQNIGILLTLLFFTYVLVSFSEINFLKLERKLSKGD